MGLLRLHDAGGLRARQSPGQARPLRHYCDSGLLQPDRSPENLRKLIVRYAGAVIANTKGNLIVLRAQVHLDGRAARCAMDRVAQHVLDRAMQQFPVAIPDDVIRSKQVDSAAFRLRLIGQPQRST